MRVSKFTQSNGHTALDLRDLDERELRHVEAFLQAFVRRVPTGEHRPVYALDVDVRST